MKHAELQKLVDEQIAHGFGRQQVFDTLAALRPDIPVKKLAKAVRYTAPLHTRTHYQGTQRALLALIVLNAALAFAMRWAVTTHRPGIAGLVFLSFATVLLAVAVHRWQGASIRWLALANLWSAIPVLNELRTGEVHEPLMLASRMLSILIGAVAWYLAVKVYPRPTEEPSLPGTPPLVRFAPEPGEVFR